ncbi:hypothetical protein [Yimella sp. cx-51]|uniref:hypothetical protein n=1 Tax=Yimella sp. cx-51 TaxID=2770551 RepID=UPI00165DAFB2|nr:hypothetical protein [Yimella sp. cx-51]MBC9958306.1 hypothetical protein [Yimella sp. cx-51]QTH38247.1 hypothetical protein J5M86_00690 [Yimella sp. cx-51]
MKKITAAACLLAFPLLAGCNASDVTTTTPSSSSSSSSTTDPSTSPTEGTTQASGVLDFGKTYQWDNKVSVTVKDATDFTPSDYTTKNSRFSKFTKATITLTNNTDKPIEARNLRTSATSGDRQTPELYDYKNDVGRPSTAKILPGKSLSWEVGYGYTSGEDLTVTLTYRDYKTDDYKTERPEAIFNKKM